MQFQLLSALSLATTLALALPNKYKGIEAGTQSCTATDVDIDRVKYSMHVGDPFTEQQCQLLSQKLTTSFCRNDLGCVKVKFESDGAMGTKYSFKTVGGEGGPLNAPDINRALHFVYPNIALNCPNW